MEEAMTSELDVEATSEEISTDNNETAGNSKDGQTNDQRISVSSNLDLKDVPEEAREYVKKYVDEHADREFKRYLTNHTQKQSSEYKQREQEYQAVKRQYEETQQLIQAALQNPEVYEQYRRQLGLVKEEAQEEQFPQTVEELHGYLKKLKDEVAQAKKQAVEEARNGSLQDLQKREKDSRYTTAVAQLKSEVPAFGKYEKFIIQHMKDNFMGLYNGSNEYEVMKKAAEDFQTSILDKEAEARTQALLESMKLKKEGSTLTPQKKVALKSSQGDDMREAIIAKVRERFGD